MMRYGSMTYESNLETYDSTSKRETDNGREKQDTTVNIRFDAYFINRAEKNVLSISN